VDNSTGISDEFLVAFFNKNFISRDFSRCNFVGHGYFYPTVAFVLGEKDL
jgi:hypothetical protein